MSEYSERLFEVAQLAHAELLTPDLKRTLWFFKDLLGLQESGRRGDSVYLRAYEDYYHHTLKVTAAQTAGLGHVAWRTTSPQALERRSRALEASGLGEGWNEGDLGHGRAYRFRTPDGHKMELFWDVDYFNAPPERKTRLRNRPEKRPLHGVPVRRLDHINLLASDVAQQEAFMRDRLGFRVRENIKLRNGTTAGTWMSVSALVHELAFMGDRTGAKGRLHHLCYWYGYPQHLADISDVFKENGVQIEAGPGKHGISQAYFLYVFEPGGNRVELFGDSGYLIFDPDWKTITWGEDELDAGIIWYGSSLPAEYFMYGTPAVQKPKEATAASTGA
ncbi:MAG: catechol 2,3-dioxygenase [Acidobacteria bacterium]|nr:catechol 2,3-dioxygenase [Acidobacteriota bacterium]